MSLLVPCPGCGLREYSEFSYGGETNARPRPDAPVEALANYLYVRRNSSGTQQEWWYHRDGCRGWFLALRNTTLNSFEASYWPEDPARRTG